MKGKLIYLGSEDKIMSVDSFIMAMKKLLGFGLNLDVVLEKSFKDDVYSIGIDSEVSIEGKITLDSFEKNSTTTIYFSDGGKITTLTTEIFKGDN